MHNTYINVIVVSCVLFALCRAAGILYPGVVAQQMAGGRGYNIASVGQGGGAQKMTGGGCSTNGRGEGVVRN